jgi:hypothetical protein
LSEHRDDDALFADGDEVMLQEPASRMRTLMWILWPSFLVAGVAEILFFTIFDPFELHFFGEVLDWSRSAIYTLGFFGFWGLGIASSTFTLFLERSPRDLPPAARS